MYKVVSTSNFKKSLKKIEKSGKYSVVEIRKIIEIIALGKKLDEKLKDHKLHGELSNYRECHIKSNLLLIYKKDDQNLILLLVNIGSHDDLFK